MICHMPVLVGAGQLPDPQIKAFCKALHGVWGGEFLEFSSFENPIEILGPLAENYGLIQLLGDPAKTLPNGGNWLESLGAFKRPIFLIVSASDDGVSGNPLAYAALCKELSVPLLGIVQYGGKWEPNIRELEGLPWCGYLPEVKLGSMEIDNCSEEYESVLILATRLKQKLLCFKN